MCETGYTNFTNQLRIRMLENPLLQAGESPPRYVSEPGVGCAFTGDTPTPSGTRVRAERKPHAFLWFHLCKLLHRRILPTGGEIELQTDSLEFLRAGVYPERSRGASSCRCVFELSLERKRIDSILTLRSLVIQKRQQSKPLSIRNRKNLVQMHTRKDHCAPCALTVSIVTKLRKTKLAT